MTASLARPRRLSELTWPKVQEALENGCTTIIFGAGATEQHGPHMPLMTDALIGEEVTARVAVRLPDVLMGPTLGLGISPHHMSFPGTISLTEELFLEQVTQYVASLAAHGFRKVFAIPTHGGNFEPLETLRQKTGGWIGEAEFVPYTDLLETIGMFEAVAAADGISAEDCGAHAGDFETSIVLALRPELVDMSRAEAGFLGKLDAPTAQRLFSGGTRALSENGILGNPIAASAERGERYLQALEDLLVDYFAAH